MFLLLSSCGFARCCGCPRFGWRRPSGEGAGPRRASPSWSTALLAALRAAAAAPVSGGDAPLGKGRAARGPRGRFWLLCALRRLPPFRVATHLLGKGRAAGVSTSPSWSTALLAALRAAAAAPVSGGDAFLGKGGPKPRVDLVLRVKGGFDFVSAVVLVWVCALLRLPPFRVATPLWGRGGPPAFLRALRGPLLRVKGGFDFVSACPRVGFARCGGCPRFGWRRPSGEGAGRRRFYEPFVVHGRFWLLCALRRLPPFRVATPLWGRGGPPAFLRALRGPRRFWLLCALRRLPPFRVATPLWGRGGPPAFLRALRGPRRFWLLCALRRLPPFRVATLFWGRAGRSHASMPPACQRWV